MPILRVDVTAQGPALNGGGDLDEELSALCGTLAPDAPVIVLVHGYKFAPDHPRADPHRHILSLTPISRCPRALSWPLHLGFGRGHADEGLCIAFGWPARGTIWGAWRRAEEAGAALATLLTRIALHRSGPVDMVAHSLGARVCLSALAGAPAGSAGRILLMAAAEYRSNARAAVQTAAGRGAEVINITTRENDPFDALLELFVRPPEPGDRALGAGLDAANWLDVQIDAEPTRNALASLGLRIPPPRRRVCHWSGYLRPGLLKFYALLLRCRDRHTLADLRRILPADTDPRWTRLRPALPDLLGGAIRNAAGGRGSPT